MVEGDKEEIKSLGKGLLTREEGRKRETELQLVEKDFLKETEETELSDGREICTTERSN